MKALTRSSDLLAVTKGLKPRDMRSTLRLPHREPKPFAEDLERLDEAMIRCEELALASKSCHDQTNRFVLMERAREQLRAAKRIDAWLRKAGSCGASRNEMVKLEGMVG